MERSDALADLPGLAAFGEALVTAVRADEQTRRDAPGRRLRTRARRSRRALAIAALLVLLAAAVAAAATVAILRASVIQPPGAADVSPEQTPVPSTTRIAAARAADPAGGPPWALRIARTRDGEVCTTIGQVRRGVFGIVGLDGVFRRIPAAITDGCTAFPTYGAMRVVIGRRTQDARTIMAGYVPRASLPGVYQKPCAGRCVEFDADGRVTEVPVDRSGIFVFARRGYPEDARTQGFLRYGSGFVPDPAGSGMWVVQPELERSLKTPVPCARVRLARAPLDAAVTTQPVCVMPHSGRAWAAYARRYAPGDGGVTRGSGSWQWRTHPARTVVWGLASSHRAIRSVVLTGAGPRPLDLAVSRRGAFAAVLPASVDPRRLRIDVLPASGFLQHVRPAFTARSSVPGPFRRTAR